MYQIFQTPTRFASGNVAAWCGHHKVHKDRRWVSEEKAFEEVCERVAALTAVAGRQPEFDTEDKGDHITIRVFGVTWVVRRV